MAKTHLISFATDRAGFARCPVISTGARLTPRLRSRSLSLKLKALVTLQHHLTRASGLVGAGNDSPYYRVSKTTTAFVFAVVTIFSHPAQAYSPLDSLLSAYDRTSIEGRIAALENDTAMLATKVKDHSQIIKNLVWPDLPNREDK